MSAALLLSATWSMPRARADMAPAIRVTGRSPCPTPAAVRREIVAFTRTAAPGEPAYELRVTTAPDGARVGRLLDNEGEEIFERRFLSDDCAAVAAAFGLVLHAQFVELGVPLPASAAAVEHGPAAPVTDTTPPQIASVAALSEPPVPTDATTASRWSPQLTAALGAGVELPEPSARGSVSLGAGLERSRLLLHLLARASPPSEDGSAPDRIRRSTGELLAAARLSTRTRVWLAPRLGAGYRLSTTRAVDVVGSEPKASASPVIEIGLCFGVRQRRAHPWFEVNATYLLDRDHYFIEPRGAIGAGPRGEIGLKAGFDLELAKRSRPRFFSPEG